MVSCELNGGQWSVYESRPDNLYAFCHIQKTGGITWLTLLRRYFGLRHQDHLVRAGQVLLPDQLDRDLRLNPFARSISSHGLWPCVDYPRQSDRLVWYTMLREPISRYISHYNHHAERWNAYRTFDEWLDIDMQRNWQTKMIGGGEDVQKAKEILRSKVEVVGLLERFNESCLLFRDRFKWRNFRVAYGLPQNRNRGGAPARRVREEFDRYKARIIENNKLDIELYEFAKRELWPAQVAAYGEKRMLDDLQTEFSEGAVAIGDRFREFTNNTVRRAVYRPLVRTGDFLYGRKRAGAAVRDERLVVADSPHADLKDSSLNALTEHSSDCVLDDQQDSVDAK